MPVLRLSNEELIALSIIASIGTTVISAGHSNGDDWATIHLTGKSFEYYSRQLSLLGTAVYGFRNPDADLKALTAEQFEASSEETLEIAFKANEALIKAATRLFDRLTDTNMDKDNGPR